MYHRGVPVNGCFHGNKNAWESKFFKEYVVYITGTSNMENMTVFYKLRVMFTTQSKEKLFD